MASMNGWVEGILFSLAFLAVAGTIVLAYNEMYSGSNSIPLVDNSGAQGLFNQYMSDSQAKIQGGDVQFDAQQGITLKQAYSLMKDLVSILWNFISGGWISDLFAMTQLGEAGIALAFALRVIFFVSVIGAVLYALFKVTI